MSTRDIFSLSCLNIMVHIVHLVREIIVWVSLSKRDVSN